MSRELVRIFMSSTSWMLGLFLLTAPLPALAITETEAAKLLASDGSVFDYFGHSVAISGDRAVIGAWRDGDNGLDSGSAYVFERDGAGNWSEVAKLLASDGAGGKNFGWSVAISGDRAVIGARHDDDHGQGSGSAYVFERDGAGNWSEVVKLLASDGAVGKNFGRAVAISGGQVVIGASDYEFSGDYSGAAYVFERDGAGNWTEVAKLLPSDGVRYEDFGYSVAISGDRAVIGAWHDDDNGYWSGAAYVFERDRAGDWGEVAKLLPSDGSRHDEFGRSVAISGGQVVIGTRSDDNGPNAGSAYVFERDGAGNWTEVAKLLASDGAAGDYFGVSVAISGDQAVIGAYKDGDNGHDSGSAYVFEPDHLGNWTEVAKLLASDGAASDYFGVSVAISGDRVLIGAEGDDGPGPFTGSAYVFSLAAPPPKTYKLSVTMAGKGRVTSKPAGIDCGTDCTARFDEGTRVRLIATPDKGFRFAGWSGACSGTGKCVVTMNRARSVMASFEPSSPDFVVTRIKLTPAKPTADGTFNAKVTVENQGTAAADGGKLLVWTNQKAARSCGAKADQSVAVGNLAAGASKTLTLRRLGAGPAGAKTFRAFVDGDCATAESDEDNNQMTKAYRVGGSDLPDFVVTGVELTPARPTAGDTFTVKVTVENQGTAAGDGGYVDVWSDQPKTRSCGDLGESWAEIGNLAAGASKTIALPTRFRAGRVGRKNLRAYADSWCETKELNERNNQYTTGYRVR